MGWVWDVIMWAWPASLLLLTPLGVIATAVHHWVWGPRWEKQHHLTTWYDVRDYERKPIDPTRPREQRPAPKPIPKVWGVDD